MQSTTWLTPDVVMGAGAIIGSVIIFLGGFFKDRLFGKTPDPATPGAPVREHLLDPSMRILYGEMRRVADAQEEQAASLKDIAGVLHDWWQGERLRGIARELHHDFAKERR